MDRLAALFGPAIAAMTIALFFLDNSSSDKAAKYPVDLPDDLVEFDSNIISCPPSPDVKRRKDERFEFGIVGGLLIGFVEAAAPENMIAP